ncbi:hypothetical protein SAMN05216241_101305 [Limimonas halophila]|uniref:Uncharacterized protein n=1 Tax=Limimonas halophila TaxID=1082479 RepID=A0A1G7LM18_9PROT|nr:hypothetical protein [Limimonas halophila]SDF50577.1 hypothetical protein SAMN05216241_101305 [Limimonas halophila]
MERFVTLLAAAYLLGVVAAGMHHGIGMSDRGWPVHRVVAPSLAHGLAWPVEAGQALEGWLTV